MKPRVKTGAGNLATSLFSSAVSRRTEILVAAEISSSEISRTSLSRRSSSPNVRIGVSPIVRLPGCGSLMLDLSGALRKDSFRAGLQQRGGPGRVPNPLQVLEAGPRQEGQSDRVGPVCVPEHSASHRG